MKIFTIVIAGALLVSCGSSKNKSTIPVDTSTVLLNFDFNESATTVSEVKTGAALSIAGDAERIAGLEENALRVNGWYGWASGTVTASYPINNICLSGWIAPSSFPVQRKDADPIDDDINAAIFSNINPSTGAGIALGVNQHGKIIGQFKVGNENLELLSDEFLQLKKWSFIALNVNASEGNAKLYLNGAEIQTMSFVPGQLQWSSGSGVFIGKESKTRQDASFDTNGLNGAIEQVTVFKRSLTPAEIQAQYAAASVTVPDLSIPEDRFADDPHRPKYHCMPTAGWTNEPHGLFYLDGKYHLFSQRNLNGPYWGHLNWGHFESADLVNWEEKQQILWPTPGFDEVGVWSGHTIIKENKPYVFYTGVNKVKAAIGLATADAPYETWTKHQSPVIAGVPTNIQNADFRDPFIFQHNNDWYMMVGTGLRNGTARGGLFLYKSTSPDFFQWTPMGTMLEGNPGTDNTGDFWEMPAYYNFGSKAIVLINKLPNANALYWTGTFNGTQFVRDNAVPQRLDVINHLLSPSIAPDENGNLTAIGIIADQVNSAKHKEQGWAHVFSLPRVWTLEDDKIVQKPHPSLESLRGPAQNFSNIPFSDASQDSFNGAAAAQYEIVASLSKGTATKVGFSLSENAATNEKTLIYYDYTSQSFIVDRSNSSILTGVPLSNQASSFPIAGDQPINWRIFVDASVIEVFVNDKLAFATRSFPSAGSNGIDLFAQGGTATANAVTIYNIEGGGVQSVAREASKKKLEVSVYPNPSTDVFNICFDELLGGSYVQAYVVSLSGLPVKKIDAMLNPENTCLTWDGMSDGHAPAIPGVYFVVGMMNGEMFQARIIKKQ